MSETHAKIIILLKRKQGMSLHDFKLYYETKHSKLIRLVPGVQRYLRRYVEPYATHPDYPSDGEYDVVTELWFKNREDRDIAILRQGPEIQKIFADDEENLFDRPRGRMYAVTEEHVSDMAVDGYDAHSQS